MRFLGDSSLSATKRDAAHTSNLLFSYIDLSLRHNTFRHPHLLSEPEGRFPALVERVQQQTRRQHLSVFRSPRSDVFPPRTKRYSVIASQMSAVGLPFPFSPRQHDSSATKARSCSTTSSFFFSPAVFSCQRHLYYCIRHYIRPPPPPSTPLSMLKGHFFLSLSSPSLSRL